MTETDAQIANPEAERAVLSALLLNSMALAEVLPILGESGDYFFMKEHALIYTSMIRVAASGAGIVDSILLSEDLERNGDLQAIGGHAYIADVSGAAPTSANVARHAEIVREAATKRCLCDLGKEIVLDSQNGKDSGVIIAKLLSKVDALPGVGEESHNPENVLKMLTEPPPATEYIFDGLLPCGAVGGMVAAGGRGKSWLTLELVLSAAIGRVLLPSFEPSGAMRVMSISSEDPPEEMHRRLHKIANFFRLSEKEIQLATQNIHMEAGKSFPLARLQNGRIEATKDYRRLEGIVKKFQPRLIVIDPQAHFFSGDENDNSQASAFVGLLQKLTTLNSFS